MLVSIPANMLTLCSCKLCQCPSFVLMRVLPTFMPIRHQENPTFFADFLFTKALLPPDRGWPEELGGQWLPPFRGHYSLSFLDQLQRENPNVPLWPDPEDARNAAAADRVPTEKFAFMPSWKGIGYWSRGRQGYWDPKITSNIPQHMVCCCLSSFMLS